MSELSPGRWQPWEPDRRSRHQCGSGFPQTLAPFLRKGDPETRPSPCPWCSQPVYYHTNGHGDSVYFDALGVPWQVHPCWEEYWETQINNLAKVVQPKYDRLKAQQQYALLKEEQKYQRLLNAINNLIDLELASSDNISNQHFYFTESQLAKKLSRSLSKFRQEYGHLYSVRKNDERIINLSYPQITIQEGKGPVQAESTKNTQSTKKQKKRKKKTVVEREEMVRCLYCRTIVRKSLMERHLLNAHKIDTSGDSPRPKIQPLKGEAGCPYCFYVTFEHSLGKHIQKHYKKIKKNDPAIKLRKPLDVCPCCLKAVQDFQKHLVEKHPDQI